MTEDLKTVVDELMQQYQNRRNEVPNVGVIEQDLYLHSGIDRADPHAIVLVDLGCQHLPKFGSVCGSSGNRVFSNQSLASFLRNRWIAYFLGIVHDPSDPQTFERGSIPLSSVALPITGKDCHVFQNLVKTLGGSFRYGISRAVGWSVYESE